MVHFPSHKWFIIPVSRFLKTSQRFDDWMARKKQTEKILITSCKLSALLSLIFGGSSSWCSMRNKAAASSIQLGCHRIKKSHINHAFMLSCSLELLPQCQCCVSQRYQAYCCMQSSREKKTEKILITSCQLCWAWYLEDHPLEAAWQKRHLLLAYN